MATREIFVNIDEYEKRVAIVEDKRLAEYQVQRNSEKPVAGNIYKGKVAQIVKGMEAAFVDIGLEKNGFLYIDELLPEHVTNEEYTLEPTRDDEAHKPARRKTIEELLRKGQEVLVQVVKEPFGTKGCRLSNQISLPGRFLVLMPYSKNLGISKRITNEKERSRLRAMLREIGLAADMGCIVRTQAAGLDRQDAKRELRYLIQTWQTIKARAAKQSAPSLLHEESDVVLRIARDIFCEDFTQMLIDDRDEYARIIAFVRALAPALKPRVKLYREKMTLFEKFEIEQQTQELFKRQVHLKRGGYIVIERTEALVSIDVNSGKFVDRRRLEDTAFLTNLEAAAEIARQIRLRDLGGIIMIDFIDMQDPANQKKVMQELSQVMEKDKARFTIYPFSPLGVVQIARQRVRKNLEHVMFHSCPACGGWGKMKSPESIAIQVLRSIAGHGATVARGRCIEVRVHPQVAMRLFNEERSAILALEKKFGIKIALITDSQLPLEEVKFL